METGGGGGECKVTAEKRSPRESLCGLVRKLSVRFLRGMHWKPFMTDGWTVMDR